MLWVWDITPPHTIKQTKKTCTHKHRQKSGWCVQVKINATAFNICDPSPKITFVSITSNEPDNGIGDGNTVNDIVIVDNFTFNLRAERSGTGSGRIYTITYKATDASGNYVIKSVTVEVPHNQ